MLSAAAFCSATPLLIPEVAQAGEPALQDLSAACVAALRAALSQGELVALVGAATQTGVVSRDSIAAPYGWGVGSGGWYGRDSTGDPARSGGLTVGVDLIARVGWEGPLRCLAVGPHEDGAAADALRTIGEEADRVVVVALADGSTSRTAKAPRSLHPLAGAYDETLAAALGEGSPEQLSTLDTGLARDVGADDVRVHTVVGASLSGRHWQASTYYDDAPFGVGYIVAAWL